MARTAPTSIQELEDLEKSLTLPHFTADDAWDLGCILRKLLLETYPDRAAMISIVRPTPLPHHVLFHSATASGTQPDNMLWIARKTAAVIRFGRSSYILGVSYKGDEEKFLRTFGLWGTEDAKLYAIHGGGVPVRVKGVEGMVAVAIVSGLKQEDDHMMVIQGLEELKKKMG